MIRSGKRWLDRVGRLGARAVLVAWACALCGEAFGRSVRVAFYNERGYCARLEDGTCDGLVPALVDRLADRLGWSVEWVEVPFAQGLSGLAEGTIDLMGGVVNRPDRRAQMNFTRLPIAKWGPSLYVRWASPHHSGILSKLNGCTLGAVRGYSFADRMIRELANGGVMCQLRLYDDTPTLERALFTGEVAGILTDATPNLQNERAVFSLPDAPLFFATAKGDPELAEEIDAALATIFGENPLLIRRLMSIYFPQKGVSGLTLTGEERAWINRNLKEHRLFRVDVSPGDELCMSVDAVTGRIKGPLGVLLDEVSFMTGLQFCAAPIISLDAAAERFRKGLVDIWLPFGFHERLELGESEGVRVKGLHVPDACCTRRYSGREFTDPSSRIAVWRKDHERLKAYSKLGYATRLVICETREDCVRMVLDGRADVTVFAYPIARRLAVRLDAVSRLDVRVVEGAPYESTLPIFVGKRADPRLVAILQKAFQSLTHDRLVDLTHRAEAQENFVAHLSSEQRILWLGLPLFLFGLLLLLILDISRRRVKRALHRANMSLHVADDALNEATATREKIREARDRAEEAARAKTNFLATMSHEIRTPLNAVIGYSEFLAAPGLSPRQVGEYARGINLSANALLALINDILDISKFESGRTEGLDMRMGTCDVAALFRETADVFRLKSRQKGLEVVFAAPPNLPRLVLAEARLRQVLFNLVGNAIKFTERGRVEVKAAYADGLFTLVVSDTGIGISPRGLKTVFDPFMQDLESRAGKVFSGTGLGLSVVRRLAEASGGTVRVASELGKGSTFTVEIPGVRVAPQAERTDEAPDSADRPKSPFQKVLIVDDMRLNCRILALHCRALGVGKTVAFTSGSEALSYLDGDPTVDLVLSDMWMPGMNGREFAQAVRTRRPDLPVVAVTADRDALTSCGSEVFRAVLVKPVTAAKLREIFSELTGTGDRR